MEKAQMTFSKESLINHLNCSIKDHYEIVSQIGKGGYSKVFEVRNKTTNAIHACKYISKLKMNEKTLKRTLREINMLKKLDHPNIIKLYEVYESKRSIYLIMEKCNGGDLFDNIIEHITKGRMYSEKQVSEIILQILSAINYCHKNGICHRDLKPENILLLNKENEENNKIKIIDFGLSQYISDKKLNSKVGTAYYVPPEVLSGEYTEKCDVWSIGIILCVLLTGEPPFNGANDSIIYNKIKNYNYHFSQKWRYISNEAKDLVSHMLVPENIRYDISQVISHPWFKKNENINESNNTALDCSPIINYHKNNFFKKMILYYISSKLDDKNLMDINKIFKLFDKDNDGQISLEEFQNALTNSNLKSDEINLLFNSLDMDKNGSINYTEFISAYLPKQIYLKNELLADAFAFFDKKNNGTISREDIISALKINGSDNKEIEHLIKKIDKNGEEVIDKEKFLEIMKKE
jgi:calcium-dependent protein kinase